MTDTCPDSLEYMSTYELIADLPLTIEGYDLEGLTQHVSSDFERKSTIVHLRGQGEEGLGEDVVYDAVDHEIMQAAGPVLQLAGSHTLGSFSEQLAGYAKNVELASFLDLLDRSAQCFVNRARGGDDERAAEEADRCRAAIERHGHQIWQGRQRFSGIEYLRF